MTRQRRRVIGFILLLVGIAALFLLSFGLYVRFVGAGNPVGFNYILAGCVVAMGGSIPARFISR